MTKDDAIKKLKLLQQDQSIGGFDQTHIEADQVLCDFLNSLGHSDLVMEYERVEPKYYA